MNLLIIEDEPQFSQLLSLHLQPICFNDLWSIRNTDRVGIGLTMHHAEPADVVLLDLNLRDYQNENTLKRVPGFSGAAVVLLTGNKDPEIMVKAWANGIDTYVNKQDLFPEDVPAHRSGERLRNIIYNAAMRARNLPAYARPENPAT